MIDTNRRLFLKVAAGAIGTLGVALLLVGCSGGDVSGAYVLENKPEVSLRLTKDGKFLRSPDYVGTYSVDGKTIIAMVGGLGGAEGTIDGNNIIFPNSQSIVGGVMKGTWVKQ